MAVGKRRECGCGLVFKLALQNAVKSERHELEALSRVEFILKLHPTEIKWETKSVNYSSSTFQLSCQCPKESAIYNYLFSSVLKHGLTKDLVGNFSGSEFGCRIEFSHMQIIKLCAY